MSSEIDVKFLDPGISRKGGLINQSIAIKGKILLPSLVEINESGICNRTCSFCPKSDPNYPNVSEFVPTKTVLKLCTELGELGYSGLFVFSGFCEPLLDKNIYTLINIASKKMPNAKIEVVTNGDPLNKKNMVKLFKNGLSTVVVSAYDGKEQIDYFKKMAKEVGIEENRVVVRPRYLSKDKDYGITLNNRSGLMSNAEHKIKKLDKPMVKACNYPFYSFFMDYNGDVLLCAHDWGKKMIVGNINKRHFLDIWNGDLFNFARKKLVSKDRGFKPCNVCDVNGTLMGNDHVKIWKKQDI
jgi:radical SAM protein with 4Fe4S-binding SPASM domain